MVPNIITTTSNIFNTIYKVSHDKYIASYSNTKDYNVKRRRDKLLIISIYEHISAPFRHITHITDNIYLGNAYNAADYEYLIANNIKCIVNATDEINNYYYNKNFIYMKLNGIIDNSTSSIKKYFNDFLRFIQDNKTSNILIHCYMGSSRSATLVVLYLVYYNMYTFENALKYVEEKCPRINININYINELKEYTNKIY
jgi:hypothetical protein